MGVRLICYTGLSDLFHSWPQNSLDMIKLVSVLFQAIDRSSQTSVIYRAVWSIPPLTTELARQQKYTFWGMEQDRKTWNKTESWKIWMSVLFCHHKSDRNKSDIQILGVCLIPGSRDVCLILYSEVKMGVWLIIGSDFWLISWSCLT